MAVTTAIWVRTGAQATIKSGTGKFQTAEAPETADLLAALAAVAAKLAPAARAALLASVVAVGVRAAVAADGAGEQSHFR